MKSNPRPATVSAVIACLIAAFASAVAQNSPEDSGSSGSPVASTGAASSSGTPDSGDQDILLVYRRVLVSAHPESATEQTNDTDHTAPQADSGRSLVLIELDPPETTAPSQLRSSATSVDEVVQIVRNAAYGTRWLTAEDMSPPGVRTSLQQRPTRPGAGKNQHHRTDTAVAGVISKMQCKLVTSDGQPSRRRFQQTFLSVRETDKVSSGGNGHETGKIKVLTLLIPEGESESNVIDLFPVSATTGLPEDTVEVKEK